MDQQMVKLMCLLYVTKQKKNEKSKKKNDRHKKIRENPRVPEAIQCGSEHLWNKTDELLFCR